MRTLGVVALTLAVAGVVAAPGWCTEQGPMKDLPTLLIKGEVVSLDAGDPSATLLKVKDRYGFETPIFITPETKVTQGDQALPSSSLQAGKAVEVEYSFDINTAKRYAVLVTVPTAAPEPAASLAPIPATETAAPASAPAASEPAVVTPPAAAPSGDAAGSAQPAAPAEAMPQEQPATTPPAQQ